MDTHVGLIGGVGHVASKTYAEIFREEGVFDAIHAIDIDKAEVRACFRSHDDKGLKALVAKAASELAAGGVRDAAIGCCTLHRVAEQVFREAGIGFIDARAILKAEIQRRKKRLAGTNIGVIGTRGACSRGLLAGVISGAGAHAVVPSEDLGEELEDAILDRMAWTPHTPGDRDLIQTIVADLRRRGAKSFVVGCTDLSRVMREVVTVEQDLIDLPVLHAQAIAKVAAAGSSNRNLPPSFPTRNIA